jgi:hypothetical protein
MHFIINLQICAEALSDLVQGAVYNHYDRHLIFIMSHMIHDAGESRLRGCAV